MPNKWIEHVKDYQAKHNCSYRHALSHARETYMTGSGGKNAGYIRRLIAEKNEKFDIKKIKTPSKHILTHFSQQEEAYEDEGYENSDNEEPAPKPVRKKKVKKGMKEVDLERITAQKKQEADELRGYIMDLESLKEDRDKYNTIVGREATAFYRKKQEIEANKKRYKLEKKNQLLIDNNKSELQFRKEAENQFPDLFDYIDEYKLPRNDNLNAAFKHINQYIVKIKGELEKYK